MPDKFDKIAIADAFFKRSAKLLPCQKQMVLYWHNKGMSQRELAAMFSVSRRLITFIIEPKKLERNLEVRKKNGGSKAYYNKEVNTKAVREHRKYKHTILKDNGIV
jgi:transposase